MAIHLWSDKLGPQVPLLANSADQWRAENGMMLRVLVGSGVHGTAIEGQDDRDEMGICVEPPETVTGLHRFEHYQYRTQPEGARSGPGDLDLIVYSLRKYARLASAGNPTVLLPLFVPDTAICFINVFGRELRLNPEVFLHKGLAARFKGYMHRQYIKMDQGRSDLRAKYGFDNKCAMHLLRLGLQGIELLRTGRITLPIPEPELTWLRDLRQGKHTKQEVVEWAVQLENDIDRAQATSSLPERTNITAVNGWLHSVHQRHWSRNG